MADPIIDLVVNIDGVSSETSKVTASFDRLVTAAGEVEEAISSAFTINGYKDYLKTVRRFGKELTDELLVLQLSFGKMKAAIADSVAPIAALFVPMMNKAVAAVTEFAGYVGQFFRGLILGITGQDMLGKSAENASEQEEKLADSAKKTSSAVRRSLVAFDQLNRLSRGSGGGKSSSDQDYGIYIPGLISPEVQQVVDKVLALLRPLLEIDLQPLKQALISLGEAFAQMARLAASTLEWLWFEVLTPFIAWGMESFAPALTEFFAAALELVTAALEPLIDGIKALYQALKPVIDFVGQQVVAALQDWKGAFENLAGVFRDRGPQISGVLESIGTVVSEVWSVVSPVLSALADSFHGTFNQIAGTVGNVMGYLLDSLGGICDFLTGAFTGSWQQAWDGIVGYLKGVVNSVISLLNGMLGRFANAINSAIAGANSLSFSIPNWVPGIGGKSYSPNLSYIKTPQIPYLAQGAVLPANRPFMAVVGDQRHGTNVEAPLATIEQAVAGVMQDGIQSNLAGHEATVAVLRQILSAVLGIRIGDETIARAVNRYEEKMAVVRGV